jgi:hypothetical protein
MIFLALPQSRMNACRSSLLMVQARGGVPLFNFKNKDNL